MKVYLKILLGSMIVLGSIITKAQKTSKTKTIDTLSYLRKFEMNKDKYIGKNLEILLKDMIHIQPKVAKSIYNDDINNPMTSTSFRFSEKDFNLKNEYTLIVKWKADNIPTEPIQFTEEGNNYLFTIGYRSLLAKKIIKDIAVIGKR